MASNWEYRQGIWNKIIDPLHGENGTVSDTLHDMGFLPEIILGHEHAHFSIEVYTHHGEGLIDYEYIVFVDTNSCVFDTVCIPDLPSYLMFMREMAPLIELSYRQKDEA